MKLSKYEKRFIRMMIKVFSTIVSLFIIMTLIGFTVISRTIISGVLLIISFIVKIFYWNYLETLELNEKMGIIIQEGDRATAD